MNLWSARRLWPVFALVALSSLGYSQFVIGPMPREFAGNQKRYSPSGKIEPSFVGHTNTDSFFPQIHQSLGAKKVRPPHKSFKPKKSGGLKNRLTSGGLSGPSSSVTSTNFPGLGFNGWFPPDPHLAAGPDHLVTVVNSSVGFFSKTGTKLFEQTADVFFASLESTVTPAGLDFIFDPRVVYDKFNNRFIVLFLTQTQTPSPNSSFVVVAVSDDSNPMGDWDFFAYNTRRTISGADSWFDYPTIGLNQDGIVITGNMFGFASGFTGASILAIPTAGLYSGVGATATVFTVFDDFTIHTALSYTTSAHVFALSSYSFTAIRAWAFGSLTGTPTMTSIEIPVPAWTIAPDIAPGGTGSVGLDTIAFRMMSTAYRDGFIVGAHTTGTPDNRSQVRWYEVNLGTWPLSGQATLEQSGDINLPNFGYALMPAITKNVFNDISIIYTRSGTSTFGDLVRSSRIDTDTAGTISQPTLMASSTSPQRLLRWGDYFACVVDPFDDYTFWGIGQLTGDGIAWQTEIQSWEVSVDTGVDYAPTNVTTYQGTYVSGDLATVTTDDANGFQIDSDLIPGLGEYAGILADFVIPTDLDKLRQIKLTIDTGLTNDTTATGTLFFYNFNTGKYDYIKAFPLQPVAGTTQIGFTLKSKFSDYVGIGGQMQMIIRSHSPYRRNGVLPAPFSFSTDWLTINVRSYP